MVSFEADLGPSASLGGELPAPTGPLDELLDALFRDAAVPAVFHDGECRVLVVNDAMVRMTGRSAEELAGSDVRDSVFVRDGVDERITDRLAASVRGDVPPYAVEGTLEIRGAHGPLPARVSVRVVTDRSGDPLGVLLQVVDISRERAAREAADAARADAARFAMRVGHDLVGPLAAALGLAQALEESWLGEDDRALVQQRLVASLTGAVDAVRSLSQTATRTGEERWETTTLGELVEPVLQLEAAVLARTGGTIGIEQPDSEMAVPVAQLRAVLGNLVGNALTHGGDGPVTVRVRRVTDPAHVHLVVADDGRGVQEAALERIFAAGARLEPGTVEGQGSGLTTCRMIVAQLGGTVWAENQAGGGLAVHVQLPRRAPNATVGPGDRT